MADLDERVDREAARLPSEPVQPPEPKVALPPHLRSIDAEVRMSEQHLNQKLEKNTGLVKKIFDISMFAGSLALQGQFLSAGTVLTTLIPTYGFVRSRQKAANKEGKDFTWKQFINNTRLAQLMGYGDIAVFTIPALVTGAYPSIFAGAAFAGLGLPALSLPFIGALATLGAFYTLGVPAYNFLFNAISYVQNKVGAVKAFFSPHKWKQYAQHMYHTMHKNSWQEELGSVAKYLGPLHYIQMTPLYDWALGSNAILGRLGQSILFNNKIYADAMDRVKNKVKGVNQKAKKGIHNSKDKYRNVNERQADYPASGDQLQHSYG